MTDTFVIGFKGLGRWQKIKKKKKKRLKRFSVVFEVIKIGRNVVTCRIKSDHVKKKNAFFINSLVSSNNK